MVSPAARTVARIVLLAAMLIAVVPARATAQWRSLRSTHFQLIGNTSANELRNVALRFEQFRDIVTRLGAGAVDEDAGPPLTIVVFRDGRSFEPFMPRVNDRRVRAAGMFVEGPDSTYIAVSLANGDESFRAVFHEYSHLLLQKAFKNAPLWFNEGVAEYYSTLRITGERSALIGYPVAAHVRALQQRSMPLSRLFAVTESSPEYTDEAAGRVLMYAQAWALVHHAHHTQPSRSEAIRDLALRLAAGGGIEESVRATYRMSVSELEFALQAYVSSESYRASAYQFRHDLVTRLPGDGTRITDAEADVWLADLLAQMGRDEEAALRLEAALRQQPELPRAHAMLARVLLRQQRADEAREYLKKAAALGGADTEQELASRNLPGPRGFALVTPGNSGGAASPPPGARPFLRITMADERRSFGALEKLDCQGDLVEFVLRTSDDTVRARARFAEVRMTSFRQGLDQLLCGPQAPALPVLVTWKDDGDVRRAIALEFVPDGFVP